MGKYGDLWRITCTTTFALFDDFRHKYLSLEGHIQKARQLLGDPDKLLLLHLEVDGQMQLDLLGQHGGGGGGGRRWRWLFPKEQPFSSLA